MTKKVALVTGGSRGIGRAICLKLAEQGADLAIIYSGSADKAAETAELCAQKGSKAKTYRCNVADFAETAVVVKEIIAEFGTIDILVNNAGITKDALVMSMKEEDFDSVIDVNLKGTFNMIKHCYPIFARKRSGKIINISSVSGVLGNAGQANYSASKGGVISMTKSVARELAGRGVTCNAIAPGFIQTDMTGAMDEKILDNIVATIPLKRMGQPEDVAELAAFLAGERSSYITGQVFSVDGGLSM